MIYDCFTFFNELDLLEIRLNTLNEVVDKFVLVEATRTYSGQKKELYFEKNKARFEKFSSKIIHIIVDDMPEMPKEKNGEYWNLEFFQRNAIVRGISSCKNDDVMLISDVDEIPNPEKILKYKNYPGIKVFVQKMFSYYLNNIDLKEPLWTNSSTRMLNYADFVKNGALPQKTKFLRGKLIRDGGWHFSYLGGAEKIAEKIQSFTHILDKETVRKYSNPDHIQKRIEKGEFLHDTSGKKRFVGIKIDQTFPKYIQENANTIYTHLTCPVTINFGSKLLLWKNEVICHTKASIKNIFFTNHIRKENYENN